MKRVIMGMLCMAAPALIEAQTASGPVYDSYRKAIAVVGRALEAHGGADAVRGLRGIDYRFEGFTYDRDQGVNASSAFVAEPPKRAVAVGAAVDFSTGRRRMEFGLDAPGEGRLVTRTVQRGRELLRYSPAAQGTDRTFTRDSLANDGSTSFPFQHQLMPVLVLRQAIVRSMTLRYVGRRSGRAATEELVSFNNADGSVLAIGIDSASGLVNTVETVNDVGLFGDTDHIWRFSEYERSGGLLIPRAFQHRINGLLQEDMRLIRVAVNPAWTDTSFAPPTDYTLQTAVVAPRGVSVADSGGGVYFIEGLGGYRIMFVDTPDGIVVVEAPQSVRIADQAIAMIERTIPGKRISHLVLTHHHIDHVGGARAYVDRGVTIVVPRGIESFLRRILAGTRTLGTLGQPVRLSREPLIEVVTDKRSIGPLQLLYTSTSHAADMLIAYVPSRQLVFQADLFRMDDNVTSVRASATAGELVALIDRHKLAVRTVASVHGRNATLKELLAAVPSRSTR